MSGIYQTISTTKWDEGELTVKVSHFESSGSMSRRPSFSSTAAGQGIERLQLPHYGTKFYRVFLILDAWRIFRPFWMLTSLIHEIPNYPWLSNALSAKVMTAFFSGSHHFSFFLVTDGRNRPLARLSPFQCMRMRTWSPSFALEPWSG